MSRTFKDSKQRSNDEPRRARRIRIRIREAKRRTLASELLRMERYR